MALVKGPLFSMQASGNMGAICFTRMPSGAVARSVWTGTQTSTAPQLAQRVRLTAVAQYWSGTLNDYQREQWREAAREEVRMNRLQIPYRISGYQFFIQMNLQAKVAGKPVQDLPPIKDDPVRVTNLRLRNLPQPDADHITIWLSGEVLFTRPDSDAWQLWRAGPFNGGGRKPIEGEWRLKQNYITANSFPDGDVVDTKYYWYRCRYLFDTGIVGNFWVNSIQFNV